MPMFEVVRPWHGVVMGEVFDSESVHPALASHVREVSDKAAAKLVVASPKDEDKSLSKADLIGELKKAGIKYDGRSSAEELAALLEEAK